MLRRPFAASLRPLSCTSVPNAVYLVDSATGNIAATLKTGGSVFAQIVFADRYVFTTAGGMGITAYHGP